MTANAYNVSHNHMQILLYAFNLSHLPLLVKVISVMKCIYEQEVA